MIDIYNNNELAGKLDFSGKDGGIQAFDSDNKSVEPDSLLDLLSGYVHNFGEKHPKYRNSVNYNFTKILKSALQFGNTKYRNITIKSTPDSIHGKLFYSKDKTTEPAQKKQWDDDKDWHTVNSTAVSSVAYNPDFHRLFVQFKRSGKVYQYDGVPKNVHDNLLTSASKGRFVYYVLRNHGTDSMYSYRQV